jgi:cytochrome P450
VSIDICHHRTWLTASSEVPTFIIAGHETTSTLICWALFALATEPDVQRRLREEIRAHTNGTPSLDELNSLCYLDSVLRETLRLHSPVVQTQRVATKDDVIPLEQPVQDKLGQTMNGIRVTKGDVITIPIEILNQSVEIWGEDATVFR